MSAARAIVIRYRFQHFDDAERTLAETRLRSALRVSFGADVTVAFEEVHGDEPWRRSSVRISGHWNSSRAEIYQRVSSCLSEQVS